MILLHCQVTQVGLYRVRSAYVSEKLPSSLGRSGFDELMHHYPVFWHVRSYLKYQFLWTGCYLLEMVDKICLTSTHFKSTLIRYLGIPIRASANTVYKFINTCIHHQTNSCIVGIPAL